MNPTLLVLAGGFALFVSLIVWARLGRRRRHAQAALLRRIVDEKPAETVARQPTRRRNSIAAPNFLRLPLARAMVTPSREAVVTIGAAIAFAVALATWSGGLLTGATVFLLLVSGGLFGLRWVAERRVRALIAELPGFLDSLRQLLVIGNSFQQALSKATVNGGRATKRYFNPVVRRVNNGAPVPDSIAWLATRIQVEELHVLAAAVEANYRYGGRMTVVLSNLIEVLRNRARIERELRGATSETRTSMKVIVVLPLAIALLVGVSTPNYVEFFTESENGPLIGIGALGLQVTGFLLMRRIMRMDF